MKPSKTINRIHFEDLDPGRFEDLCLQLIYRLNRWEDIRHYGRSGSDDGIDIKAVDKIGNDKERIWHIQAKRYKSIAKAGLQSIIDEILSKNKKIPHILIAIVSCDVSKTSQDYYREYAYSKGINKAMIWTSSVLETKLYSEYDDLLYVFFGVNILKNRQKKYSAIKRNLALKKRIKKDFLKEEYDVNDLLYRPDSKFKVMELLIRSIDDSSYPDFEEILGLDKWFKVRIWDFYFNGIEVFINWQRVIYDENRNWDIIRKDDIRNLDNYEIEDVIMVGRIPYELIIEYDIDGDEFYDFPHIYCEFKIKGGPYESLEFYKLGDKEKNEYFWRLEKSLQMKTK